MPASPDPLGKDSHVVQLLQLCLNGIAIGAIYALVALGLVMIYKATETINFAHGDILMASAFVGWGLIAVAGLPFWLAALVTILLAAALAYVLEARVMRIIVGQPQFAGAMLTFAIAFMLRARSACRSAQPPVLSDTVEQPDHPRRAIGDRQSQCGDLGGGNRHTTALFFFCGGQGSAFRYRPLRKISSRPICAEYRSNG